MTMLYQCSNCERTYSNHEYESLDRQPMYPEEEDPRQRGGYETVCECGAGFHSDKWSVQTEVELDEDTTVYIATFGLNLAHGLNDNLFYETGVTHPRSDFIADRWTTKDEAKDGHEHIVELIENEQFHFEPVSWRMVLEDEQ